MSQTENVSFRTYRKTAHPSDNRGGQGWELTEICDTLNVYDNTEGRTPILIVEDGLYSGLSRGGGCSLMGEDVTPTLIRRYESSIGNTQDKLNVMQNESDAVVRRLTPLECERLQGYPDGWTDIGEWTDSKGKKHKDADSPRYKALGNSIALPFWQWMAERMVKELDSEHPTMASLFDGIGGFPLVFSRCGCVPVWASEIEEFPIAVTKIRFPNEGSD